MTKPFTATDLEPLGFVGFETVRTMLATRCANVPSIPGVYAVTRARSNPPRFRTRSVGGWFKGQDPTVPVAVLRARWLEESDILYIGKASFNLHERVHALVKFGSGRDIGHSGGRLLWQVQGSADFVISWKPARAARPLEIKLFADFEREYGQLPFANLSH